MNDEIIISKIWKECILLYEYGYFNLQIDLSKLDPWLHVFYNAYMKHNWIS